MVALREGAFKNLFAKPSQSKPEHAPPAGMLARLIAETIIEKSKAKDSHFDEDDFLSKHATFGSLLEEAQRLLEDDQLWGHNRNRATGQVTGTFNDDKQGRSWRSLAGWCHDLRRELEQS